MLEIDFETRSPVNLKVHGAYVYFEHSETDIMLASYSFDGGKTIHRWRNGQPCPYLIQEHIKFNGKVYAHNSNFERQCFKLLHERAGWPLLPIRQTYCTAAIAAALSLPRDLDGLAKALGLQDQKDVEGYKLMRRMSTPQRGKWYGWDDARIVDRLHDYCDQDVRTEAAAAQRMVPLSADEQELYWISEEINDRGVRVDIRSAHAALEIAEKTKRQLDERLAELTGGAVLSCSQVAKLTEWIGAQGVPLDSLGKAEIEDLLEADDIPQIIRTALELRQEAAKTSVSKLKSFIARASRDGNVRGSFLYHAAGPGRWSSTGAQLHNLPRPRKEFGDAKLDQATLFRAIRTADPDTLRFLYGDELGRPLFLVSDAVRGFLWARPGHDLLAADYSGIQGAVAAWFAGEQWKIDALFELIRDPSQPDMYMRSASGIFDEPIGKKDLRRQIGKVSELSLQFQGGVGAFRSMARNYSMKLGPVYGPVWAAADERRRERAEERYEECLKRNEPTTRQLTRQEWLAAELVKVGWRAVHPAITGSWKLLEEAAWNAVERPGQQFSVFSATFLVARGFLWLRLPSGRCLAFGSPAVRQVTVPWADMTQEEERREKKSAVTVMGVDSVTRSWKRYALYGGLLFENIVMAVERDILAHGIKLSERAGYPVIGHVHDEIIAELPRGQGNIKEFEKLICQLPAWARDLPLTAGGWRGKRYRKD